jgi:hypothetical protein
MEDAMLKHLTICAALLAIWTAPVTADQQQAALKRMEVLGADFDIVLATPKYPPFRMYDLSESPDALIVHLAGGELVLAFDDVGEMLTAVQSLGSPVAASHFASKDGKSRTPFAIYVVPKAE